MIFSWFDAKAAKIFGLELADFYIARVSKNQSGKREKLIEKKQREILGKISQKIDQFKSHTTLNIYKKAQASNAFKWRMLDAGFEQTYVDEMTSWITRQL